MAFSSSPFDFQKKGKIYMRKIIMALLASVAVVLGLMPMATSNAVPGKVVTNGMKITFGEAPTADGPSCTLGVVGFDSQGRKTGITAGHCVTAPANFVGRELTDAEALTAKVWDSRDLAHGPIGYIKFISSDLVNRDYMVIKLADDVVPGSNGPALRVDALYPGNGNTPAGLAPLWSNVCKDGNTTGKTCGLVTDTTNGLIRSFAVNGPGDSGGPLVVAYNNGDATDWVGIVTRNALSFPPGIYTSAKNILDDLNPRGIYGSGFTVANT